MMNQKWLTQVEIQDWLVNYLSQLLEIDPEEVDVTNPFERYGLDSSAAVVLSGDLQDWLGCELEPELLFDCPTIETLTQYLTEKEQLTGSPSISQKADKTEILSLTQKREQNSSTYSLSYGQRALWFLYKIAPDSAAYNVAFTARIKSQLDVPILRRSFQKLIERHPMLCTTFLEQDGSPVQVVHQDREVCFEEFDALTWSWDELTSRVIENYQRPFDLEQGPILRVSLFTRSKQDYILLLTIHHIACDGWSIWMLLDELRLLYPAQKDEIGADLPPLEFFYQDYITWQAEMLASSEEERLWNYWRQQLVGELPILNLPTDRPRPPVRTDNSASQTFKLSQELTQSLRKLAQAENISLYMTLLAAFQVLLHRYTNQDDILVGSPMKCRSQPEFSQIVGYLVNSVVLRADFSENPTVKAFLHQVRHTVLAAIAHQDYPFPLLVERLQLERDLCRSPLFQANFILQKPQQAEAIVDLFAIGERDVSVNLGGLELESFAIPQQEGQFELSLEMVETQETILGVFKYNTDLFDAATINRAIEHFQILLEGMVAHPQQHISELPLLTAAERHQLLGKWKDAQADYPQGKCLHEWFEEQVERTPKAIAVGFEDRQLTYRELNRQANQLAHYLQTLGVSPDVLVGICVERSLEMVVGLLGILKAGGAYVPLDPTYPQERLTFMLEDAQVPVLLAQEHLVARLPRDKIRLVCLDTG
ncbi:MAG: condensation domain-containing protein, partial [Microcystaceae cyanobacterium]